MILYVVRYHPALTETFVRDEVAALRDAGVPVELAAFDARDALAQPDAFPVHLQPHRWGWIKALPALAKEWFRRPAKVSLRVLWLASVVRGAKRVHVHFAGEAAEWGRQACARVGVPYSLTVHAVDLYKPMPALPRVLTTAIAVVAMTEYNAALLRSKYGVSPRLIRFGINLSPGNVRRDHAPPVVLTVGRNVPKKGLDVVCRVAQNFDRPARFVLYSNLSPVESVEVHGLVAHADVLAAMASAHVFLLPCRVAPDGDMDGLPVVIVEAMAAGLPVITTPVSGIPELVDEQVGWLVPPDNVDATAQALREALDHPAEAARRGLAGQRRVREMGFDRDSLVREMRAVLDA